MTDRLPSTILRIRLFGRPHLERNDAPLAFGGGKRSWQLLCYLGLKAHVQIARDSAAFETWPDLDEEAARATFRRELHRMVKGLPESDVPWFITDERTIQWNPAAPIWVDAIAFERSIGTLIERRDALALYRGELLADIHDDWVYSDRERLRSTYLNALADEIARTRSERDYDAAITYARAILVEDPFREDAVRIMMRLRFESGDRAGALHEADRYGKLYRDELGTGLMPDTEALRDAILRDDVTDELPERSVARSTVAAYVGRRSALERARSAWSRAARGNGSAVFVGGVAGIGKSRFVNEIAMHCERQGARVLRGFTSDPERQPYEAVAGALREVLGLLASIGASPADASRLTHIVPEFARYANATSDATGADPDRERAHLFRVVIDYVRALATARPVVIVLEDLHCARTSTIEAVRALIEAAHEHPVLLIATFRSENEHAELETLREDARRERGAMLMTLEALSDEETLAMVRATPQLAALDDLSLKRFLAFSGGNPFFATEAIGHYLHHHELPDAATGMAGTVQRRLAGLEPNALDVAEIASNIGERFRLDDMRQVSGLDEITLLDAIGALIDANILAESVGRSAYDYAFGHQLIQRVVYDQTPVEKRARRHYRIATVFERGYETRAVAPQDIAFHYDAAQVPDIAAKWYARAAHRALELYANQEAVALAARALDLSTSAATRFEVLDAREAIARRMGEGADQDDILGEMRTLAPELGVTERFATVRRALTRALLSSRFDEAHARADEMEAFAQSDEPRYRAELESARGRIAVEKGDYPTVILHLERALALLSPGDPFHVETACRLAAIATDHGDFAAATTYLEIALVSSGDAPNAELVARTWLGATRAALGRMMFGEAEEFARRARDAYTLAGEREGIADSTTMHAVALARLLRFDEAIIEYGEAARLHESVGKPLGVAAVYTNLGMIAFWKGRIDDAQRSFERALDVFRSVGDIRGEIVCATNLSMVELTHERFKEARVLAARAVELAAETNNPLLEGFALANLGSAQRELGEVTESVRSLERCLALRSEGVERSELINDLGELALTYALDGRLDEATLLADEIVQLVQATGASNVWVPYALWAATRVLRQAKSKSSTKALRLAHQRLAEQLKGFTDGAERERFAQLPAHRAILEAYGAVS